MTRYRDQTFPPFPDDVPTARLERLQLGKLLQGDVTESKRLFEACRTSGFFMLDLTDSRDGQTILDESRELFDLSEPLLDLDLETKMKYKLQIGTAYGYKGVGVSKVDNKGTPDRCELWGVSKDSIITDFQHDPMPDLLHHSHPLLKNFTHHAHTICLLILTHIERNLRLPASSLTSLHTLHTQSMDQVRLLKMSPQPEGDRRTSLLAHTDYGTVTLLWNILGGLQIQRPDAQSNDDGWEYVRPEPGCCIVNLGDSLPKFTDNVVRSNLHRVTYPPGQQAEFDRYAVAYFCRPNNHVPMKALPMGRTVMVTGADLGRTPELEDQVYTAKEWVNIKSEVYKKGWEPMRSTGGKAEVAVV